MSIVISVQDLSGKLKPIELERLVWSLRYQALYQFNRSPWVEHGYCEAIDDVVLVPSGQSPPPDSWHMELLATSDQEGALGYHEDSAFKKGTEGSKPEKSSDRSSRGARADNPEKPLMKIFVETCEEDGVLVSEVCSHEMLEAAVDPNVMTEEGIRKYLDKDAKQWWIAEVGDPVQEQPYDVGAPEGRPCLVPEAQMANFAYPALFGQEQRRVATSFRADKEEWQDGNAPETNLAPFSLAPGGYMSVAPEDEPGNWTQIWGEAHK